MNDTFKIIDETSYAIYEGLKLETATSFGKNEWRTETSNGYHMLAETEYDLGDEAIALIKIKDKTLGAAPSFKKIAEFMNWTCVSKKMWDIV
jgi:hypothetical protein